MLKILDPVQEPRTREIKRPPRLDGVEGKVLGFYSNGKLNAESLLQMIAEELRQDGDFTVKAGSYRPERLATDEEWGDIDKCDAVILANGDCGACSSSGIANAIALEKRGVRAFLISTPPFTEAVRTMCRLNGASDMDWGIVEHPIGSIAAAELRERARDATAQFRASMLKPRAVPSPMQNNDGSLG